jgi:hypothetical protein
MRKQCENNAKKKTKKNMMKANDNMILKKKGALKSNRVK